MEQVPRKGAKIDKNSERRQERDDGGPNHHTRKMARWGRAKWDGRAPPTSPLARFSI